MSSSPNDTKDLATARLAKVSSSTEPRLGSVQSRFEDLKKLVAETASADTVTTGKTSGWRQAQEWNTTHLGLRVSGDAIAAATAGGIVAPLITIIDRAIIENASNRSKLLDSARASLLRLVTAPHRFFLSRPFLLVFMLYSTTYFAANSVDTISSTISSSRPASTSDGKPDPRSPAATTAGTPKFLATSSANLTLCIYKDSQFAKLFGPRSALPARPVALPSLALFAARDALTIFASFNAPSLIAPNLHRLGFQPAWEQHVSRASAAQFLAPAAVQLLSTPLHLWGLDVYNRPDQIGWRARAAKIVRDYGGSCVARVCRIVPAFGVGGVVNTRVRKGWMERLPVAAGSGGGA